jgi:AcrR family transcriptional regulator/DNA-binding transcriptional ArsR family regulator
MVVTPWGSSEKLREGKLPPGPGHSPDAVAKNQRQRLFGAMVASVAERGYWNTRVADLVALSGVSLRSFYDLFPDKRSCFVAAISSLSSMTVAAVLGGLDEGSWEEESRRRFATFAEIVAAQPAAARLFLIEAFVAGPEAVAVVEEMSREVEELVRHRLASSDAWADLPPEIGTVAVAGILEIFRSRLLDGQTQRLPGVAEEIAPLLLSYRPPAQPLRSAARPPEVRPEEREASDHAERALRAFEALLREQPFAETTMEQVAKRAKMSARTLYANFSGREDLMLAAIDSAAAMTVATVLPAFRRGQGPAEGVRGAFGALFGLFASRPNLAHLLLVGAFEGGAKALGRRREALEPFETLFTRISARSVGSQRVAAEAITGGTLGLARRRLIDEGAASLPSLTPICTYIALAPFLGVKQATAAAEGKSYRRDASSLAEVSRVLTLNDAAARGLLTLLSHGARVGELIEALPESRQEIEARLSELEEVGIIEPIEVDRQGDDRRFTTGWRAMATEEWQDRGLDERERISKEIVWVIKEEIDEAIDAGSFESRPERHLVRMPMWLDEDGWRELTSILDRTYELCLEVQRRVQRRAQQGAAEPAVPARVVLVSFETPSPDVDQT